MQEHRLEACSGRPARQSGNSEGIAAPGQGWTPVLAHLTVNRSQSSAYPRRVSAGMAYSTAVQPSTESPSGQLVGAVTAAISVSLVDPAVERDTDSALGGSAPRP
ncbi:hypothetical protein ACWD00_25395 [Streptomyces viridiviolaceus]